MSGHSKWSKVKHQKATTDVAKAAAFTRATRGLMIAVKEGGGITDPNQNFHLRLAIEKARSVNMPKENIDRAIDKAKGSDAQSIQQVSYEAYGPFGVAFFIEAATDNINRTVSSVKQAFDHAGGSMATPGAVSYLFDRKGLLLVPKHYSYDDLFMKVLDAGGDDVVEQDDIFEIYTAPDKFALVRSNLEAAKIDIDTSSLVMKPKMPVELSSGQEEQIDALEERLNESDDVQRVFTNVA